MTELETITILSKFCGGDEWDLTTDEPFTIGEWTYATDKKICVRTPKIVIPPKPPSADRLPFNVFPIVDSLPFPVIPDPKLIDCDECDGGNGVKCKSKGSGIRYTIPSAYCKVCNGATKVVDPSEEPIQVKDGWYEPRFLRLIRELGPDVRITEQSLPKMAKGYPVLFFEFGQFQGMLMPIAKPSEDSIHEIGDPT